MNNVVITGVNHSGTPDAPDFESVNLSFGKVHLEYRSQRPDGSPDTSVHFKFDVKTGKV